MKYIIVFIIVWGLMFWIGNSRLDDGYDFIPAQYNWKGAFISLLLTALIFGIIYLITKM